MIAFEHVTFGYRRSERIIADLSLRIEDGDRICLSGRSGIGKSTFIRLLTGLSKPQEGRVIVPEGTSFSVVFQEDRLIPWKSVLDNVTFFSGGKKEEISDTHRDSAHTGSPEKAPDAYMMERALLDELGLHDVMNALPEELSGGMKRRAALARALAHPFDVLILDEPFTGIDDETKERCISAVEHRLQDKILVMATHDIAEADALHARMIKM